MFSKYLNYKIAESKYLFYFVLLINVFVLFFTKFYPSMDGPAHLYNSNILNQLIGGNPSLESFYTINKIPIPNWTSHFLLSFFHVFLPSWLAEKALLVIYISGMALSFRYLIKQINPENVELSILIFPFIYSFLFHLGFYNYCMSFILFFVTLGFYLRNQFRDNIFQYAVVFILLTVTYFTNVLIFGFLGFTIGLFVLYHTFENYTFSKDLNLSIKFLGRKLLYLFIVSFPGLILLLLFYIDVHFFSTNQRVPVYELIKWINDARSFIVYDYLGEEIITEQFFHVFLVLLFLSFFHTSELLIKSKWSFLKKADIIAIPLFVLLILYFITPSASSAGMMSDRYCLAIYIFMITWTVSRSLKAKFNWIFVSLIITLHFGLIFKHLNGTIRQLNEHAISINKASDYVDENCIVLPVNLSDIWIEPHFSNYLGIEKPMMILENYEASVGWFPIKYNTEKMPNILLGNKNEVSGIQWINNPDSNTKRQINYILLYGKLNKISDPVWNELNEVISTQFSLKYNSEDEYVRLYERIQ